MGDRVPKHPRSRRLRPANRSKGSKRKCIFAQQSLLVLCDTWNWNDDNDTASGNDDNDTASGIAILDTTAIPEMDIAQCNFNVVQNSPVSAVAFPLSIGCTFESVSKKIPNETWTVSFFSLVFWLVLKLPWSHSQSQWHIHWQWQMSKLFLPKSDTQTLVVEFELIMVITHEWQWQRICTTLINKPSNLLQLQITIIPV